MYRYISRESCSQFDSLPLTSLTISRRRSRGAPRAITEDVATLRPAPASRDVGCVASAEHQREDEQRRCSATGALRCSTRDRSRGTRGTARGAGGERRGAPAVGSAAVRGCCRSRNADAAAPTQRIASGRRGARDAR